MKEKETDFILPIGYEDRYGNFHREGKMRRSTAQLEMEIHEDEDIQSDKRRADILLLSQVVSSIGEIKSVTQEVIEDLFEVDFVFLQSLYNKLNIQNSLYNSTTCKDCGNINKTYLPDIFKELYLMFAEKQK